MSSGSSPPPAVLYSTPVFVCQLCKKLLVFDGSLGRVDLSLLSQGERSPEKLLRPEASADTSPWLMPDTSTPAQPRRVQSRGPAEAPTTPPDALAGSARLSYGALSMRARSDAMASAAASVVVGSVPSRRSRLQQPPLAAAPGTPQQQQQQQRAQRHAASRSALRSTTSGARGELCDASDGDDPRASGGCGGPSIMPAAALVHHSDLFAVASDASGIDSPLCADCARAELEKLGQRAQSARLEAQRYAELLARLEARAEAARAGPASDELLARLREQERELSERLRVVAQAKRRVMHEEVLAKRHARTLDAVEERYWALFGEHTRRAREFDEALRCARAARRHDKQRLWSLCRANALNDSFHVQHDGHFGTINGYRLGRLRSVPVSWSEVNVALGFAAQLLVTCARILRFDFAQFQIVPLGSSSWIQRKDTGATYELSGDTSFWRRRLDAALVAFLSCVREIVEQCQRSDPFFPPPHKIDKDRISELSVRSQFNDDDKWTRALKFLLADLKWLVAWIAHQPNPGLVFLQPQAGAAPSPTLTYNSS
eukprot:m51a1_g11216 hypothetical protein (545) ;mRNA; r:24558-26488